MEKTFTAKDLILAVSEKNYETLIEISSENRSKKTSFTLKTILKEMLATEMDKMWDELSKIVIAETETIIIANNKTNSPSTSKRKSREFPNKKTCLNVGHLIQAAIDLALMIFEEGMPASQGLLHMVVFLNRVILEIPSNMENLKNSIALLCEKMFHLNYLYQDQELITYNAVIYLMKRTLAPKAAKKDVKRIYTLRTLIPKILNMAEVDVNEMWDLFKKVATSTLYLSMPEGQKIIGLLLTTEIDRVSDIHEAIKKRLSSCTLTQGSSYGKVYFDAWMNALKTKADKLRNELELSCFQDIVLLAVHCRQKQLGLILRKVLAQFHCQKKEMSVAKMLYYLYQPILWRYLKNPDGLIRANTAQLFLAVFPLEDPDLKLVMTDLELNEQMLLIKDLLLDDFPIVRNVTIIGLCIAMSVNWELFPEDMLKTYFKIIVNDLSCDSSATEVRCAVAKGFKVLLENPLTIATLQTVLPKLQSLFHDISDSVRIAFCQLLLRVKKISQIKYYDIVPLDHLLARMEEDTAIAKSIVNLIHNSYFPKHEGPEIWLARCVEMVKADRGASRVFFQYIANFIGLEAAAKFMVQAVKAIHFYVKSKATTKKICVLSNRSTRRSSKNFSESFASMEALEEAVGFHDPNVVSGLLDAVSIMWLSSLHNLEKPENKILLKMIVSKLSKCLGDLALYYKDTSVWQSTYYLSSFMPSRAVPSLASLCFMRLKLMPHNALPEDYMTLLECLCNQNEGLTVLMLLKDWIHLGFIQRLQTSTPPKRKSKKRKSSCPVPEEKNDDSPKPILAVRMLHALIDQRSCQKVLLSSQPMALAEMLNFADDIKRKVEFAHENEISNEEAKFLTELLFALMKISLLLHVEEKYNCVKFAEGLISWIQDKLLNHLPVKSSLNSSSRRSSKAMKKQQSEVFVQLTFSICKDVLVVMNDCVTVGFINVKQLKFMKFGMKLLSLDAGGAFLLPVSKLFLAHICCGICFYQKDQQPNILSIVPDCFSKIFQCLNDDTFLGSIPISDMRESQKIFADALYTLQQYNVPRELVTDITLLLTNNVLNSIFKEFESWKVLEKKCNSFENIPISKSGAFLLSTMSMKPKLILYFLQQLQKHLTKSGKDMKSWIACYVIVVNLFDMKNLSKSIAKELQSLVTKMEGLLPKQGPLKDIAENILREKDQLGDSRNDISRKSAKIIVDEDDENVSFEEHCQDEYKKLKEMLSQKKNSISEN